MSDLGFNKIAGAILATGLVILGLRELSDGIYKTEPPVKAGYAIQVAADTSGGAPEVADVPPDWGTVLPTADVAAGLAQSAKCASCHTFTKGGPDGTGPNNWGVIGRKPGTKPGFAYSSGMVDFGKTIPAWDYDHLYMFLKNPQAYVSGTKMTFVGIKAPQDRINLIAWLRQQSDAPAGIPAPRPKQAAATTPPSAVAVAPQSSAPANTKSGPAVISASTEAKAPPASSNPAAPK